MTTPPIRYGLGDLVRRLVPPRRKMDLTFVVLLVIALAPAPARADGAVPADSPLAVELVPIATNVDSPVGINHAGDGSGRLFITLQDGQIIVWDGTQVLPTPFLDIDAIVQSGGEQGLLGLAFHPNYESNGYFYVNYSDTTGGDTVIARYRVSAGDPNVADPTSALILLEIDQPFSNHNGGQLQFGPDGYLYIGMGDGGSGGDPGDRAQDTTELLGKMLRIDVNDVAGAQPDCGGGSNYTIPADNPFVDGPGGDCDEIFQLGLRNPWRFSFDRLTGDMFIGDVGQNVWEEVDHAPAGTAAGRNWGWRCYEGNHPFNLAGCGPESDYDFPILEYPHDLGCSVTGGYVYRGTAFPAAQGTYLFSDVCSGVVWGAKQVGGGWVVRKIKDTPYAIATFGETEDGELCFSHHSSSGSVFCVVPSP